MQLVLEIFFSRAILIKTDILFKETKMSANITINAIRSGDLADAVKLWNIIVEAGNAFPQEDLLDPDSGKTFFDSQTFTGIARCSQTGKIAGLYILHPNNVGRCGHICNASYAVSPEFRGKHVGEMLVKHCLEQARICNYKVLQFNAVVASNTVALNLYKKLGFTQLGVIPKGFRNKNGIYEDIIPHFIEL